MIDFIYNIEFYVLIAFIILTSFPMSGIVIITSSFLYLGNSIIKYLCI